MASGGTQEFSTAEQMKFELLAEGISVSAAANEYMLEANRQWQLTSADYASTSGLILQLDGDVWVNAPIAEHNPNFVDAPLLQLDLGADGLIVRNGAAEASAKFWLAPLVHQQSNADGDPFTSYGFTHTDRVRVSPVEGCSMTCKFCDLPYEFRYRTKSVDSLVEMAKAAIDDPIQPAAHVLFSGGTPREADYEYVRECYEQLIQQLPDTPVDIMMVPLDEVMDPKWLDKIGVDQISMNIEIFNRELSRKLMRRKHDQGLEHYLDSLERAAEVLGPHRVRSMLMVGLETQEDTLAGVRAIAQRGAVPVLSPFRADESTPLRNHPVPSAAFLEETYLAALEITRSLGARLGPSCVPCSHNTLTLSSTGLGDADRHYGQPHMV